MESSTSLLLRRHFPVPVPLPLRSLKPLHTPHPSLQRITLPPIKSTTTTTTTTRRRRTRAQSSKNDTDPITIDTNNAPVSDADADTAPPFSRWTPPRPLYRGLTVLVVTGQVLHRVLTGRVHPTNTLSQLERVGPRSLGVCLLTSAFVGMAFTIQFVREFTRMGLHRSVGGVLALAFSRELSPVVTAVVLAGRVGSAFAAELATMQVSEQTDTLRVLGTSPVDYLITPRVLACCIALPFLTLICFTVGLASSALLADAVYGVSINIILDSARRALRPWDIISAMIKSQTSCSLVSSSRAQETPLSMLWVKSLLQNMKLWRVRSLQSVETLLKFSSSWTRTELQTETCMLYWSALW
ncbi:putative protein TRIGALACTOSYLDIACYLGLYCEROL 1, chloroplastic [Iris pallida]|uniref:Protein TRIGALACTOSYLDIACYLGLYCEROL 1, chloroplastic n=1 Tax=Iris pallida TaxID=29817 RepID=A0AAX6HG52_IRIPA|nr:putative protein TRIGALACTOSYLDIACYLGLYCEROL 1, chloroplastic [Iris pallida]